MSPERSLHPITEILQAAQDAEADVISTPCPLCQTNVEMVQDAINKKFGTDFNIPVVFYSQLVPVAFGMDPEADDALQRNTIRSKELEDMAKKKEARPLARSGQAVQPFGEQHFWVRP